MNKNLFISKLNSITSNPDDNNNIKCEKIILFCNIMCESYVDGYLNKETVITLVNTAVNGKAKILNTHPDKIYELSCLNKFIIKFGGI